MIRIKEVVVSLFALVVSSLAPVSTPLVLLMMMSMIDVSLGFSANRITKGEEFKFNKAFNAVTKMSFFCLFTILIHLTFHLFGDVDVAFLVVKYLSWIIIYHYLLNMLYNARKIYPNSRAIPFLIEVLQLHVLGALMARMGINLENTKLKEERKDEDNEKN